MSKTVLVNYNEKIHSIGSVRLINILMDESAAMLARHGISHPEASVLSTEFITEVCRKAGGGLLYIGKKYHTELNNRDQIIQDHIRQGEKISDLALKFNLTTRQIYSIKKRQIDTAQAKDTNQAHHIIVLTAAQMFLKAGIDNIDTVTAARSLIAVITARIGGFDVYIPYATKIAGIITQIKIARHFKSGKSARSIAARYGMTVEQVKTILKNVPPSIMPNYSELPMIKTKLANIAHKFSNYPEVSGLLHETAEHLSRAEQIIKNLEGEKL